MQGGEARLSIKSKLALAIFMTSLCCLLVLTIPHVVYHISEIRSDLREELQMVASIVVRNSVAAIEFNDPISATEILSAISDNKKIAYAAIYRSDGRILASVGAQGQTGKVPRVISRFFGNDLLEKRVPVVSKGKRIGEVHICGNPTTAYARIKSDLHIVSNVLILAFLIAALLAIRLGRLISEPIMALVSTAKSIAEGRDYSIRAERVSDDEVGKLVDAFNSMIATIEERTLALRQSEERYRELVENQQEGLGVVDLDECFVFANPAAHEIFGVPQGQLVGRCLRDFVDDKNFEIVRAQTALRPTCKKTTYELEIIRPDGQSRTILLTAGPRFDSNGKFIGTFGVFRDITDRKLAEERLKQSLEEKEVLLREIHHRVKNNLQIVSSMLYLQSRGLADGGALEILNESQARIKSMALIHETLYRSQNLCRVNMAEYIRNLVSSLWATYDSAGRLASIQTDIGDIDLSIDTAIPCGLIVNELLTNSIKHAFDSGGGKIRVELSRIGGSEYELVIEDDGVGLPQDFDIDRCSTLGLRLVKALVQQIEGKLEIRSVGGAQFRVRFADQTAGGRVPCPV